MDFSKNYKYKSRLRSKFGREKMKTHDLRRLEYSLNLRKVIKPRAQSMGMALKKGSPFNGADFVSCTLHAKMFRSAYSCCAVGFLRQSL
jgi:hypothetical protein